MFDALFRRKSLDPSRKLRQLVVVIPSPRKPQDTMFIGASGHLPSRPYRTRDHCSRIASPKHHSFRGSPHHRIRIWSNGCACHPSTRQDFRGSHQPSNNARPHDRWKNDPRNVSPVHFVPSSRRITGGVHGETSFQPIRILSRPRRYETG